MPHRFIQAIHKYHGISAKTMHTPNCYLYRSPSEGLDPNVVFGLTSRQVEKLAPPRMVLNDKTNKQKQDSSDIRRVFFIMHNAENLQSLMYDIIRTN